MVWAPGQVRILQTRTIVEIHSGPNCLRMVAGAQGNEVKSLPTVGSQLPLVPQVAVDASPNRLLGQEAEIRR